MAEQDEQQPDPAHGTDHEAVQPPDPQEPVPAEPGATESAATGSGAAESGAAESDAENTGSKGPAAQEPQPGESQAGTPDAGQATAGPADDRGSGAGPGEPEFDEQAAWEAIVAGYGEEPPDPPGIKPFKSVEDLALLEPDRGDGWDGTGGRGPRERTRSGKDSRDGKDSEEGKDSKDSKDSTEDGDTTEDSASRPETPGGTAGRAGRPLGGSVSFAPGIGPRDYQPPATPDDDDDGDEGHFVPPEPPPLPAADATAKFGWLAVLGGPLLLLLAVLLGWQMTWWLTTLGIGGFIGGFATLVIRMNPGDEDDDDPGRGAVV